MSIPAEMKTRMLAAIEHFKSDIKGIRTGRANPGMLDGVMVEVYGAQTRLKEVASVTAPEARQLLITPFDPRNNAAIGKGIEKANLGIMPIVDGNVVRIKIPPMDDSVRKEMIKLCHKRREEAKIGIRNIRREANEMIKKQKSTGHIAEDLVKKLEKEIQDLTDKFCKETDELSEKKEKEISTI